MGRKLLIFCILQCLWGISLGKTFIEDMTLTLEEKEALDKFKEIMLPYLPHEYMKQDYYLIRWLRSRYYNIKDAQDMLIENLRWREENKMDTVHQEDWTDFRRDYKYSLESRDKEGRPVLYINFGDWDLRNAAVVGKSTKFLHYIDKIIDETYGVIRDEGDKYLNVSQAVLLLNVEGFNLVQHGCLQCLPIILRIIVTYETHFPGIADKIIVLNTPAIADPIIRAAKGTFHPDTNKAIFIYGTNKRQVQQALDKEFDRSQLSPELGGTKIYSYVKEFELDY